MMARLGVELGARALRGVRLEGWFRPRARVVEVECDPANPAEAVEALRQHLGPARARVQVTGAVVLLDGQADGIGIVEIREGRVTRARRVFGALDDAAAALLENGGTSGGGPIYLTPWNEDRVRVLGTLLPEAMVQPLPTVADVVGPFLPAFGAALGIGTKPNFARTLVSPELGARITARWWRQLGLAVAVGVAALVFAVASADAWSARATRELEASLQSLKQRAAPTLSLQNQLQALDREAQAIRQVEQKRPDPLGVLLALSKQLPAGAYLRGMRWSGTEWQIDGYAPNTSRLMAQLGAAPEFKEVRFLSATTRGALGEKNYESFALAFRYAPAP